MKKISRVLWILLAAALLLCGCGENASGETEAVSQKTFSPEDFMNKIQINLTALYECEAETFFADILYDTVYLAAGRLDGYNFTAEVLYEDGTQPPEGYEIDPSYSSYFRVKQLKNIEEVRGNLCQYMSEELVAQYLDPEEFFETPETLYIRRGARGYGSILPDVNSARYLGQEGGEQLVAIDYLFFGEYDFTGTLHFVKTDTGWKITQVENPYLG